MSDDAPYGYDKHGNPKPPPRVAKAEPLSWTTQAGDMPAQPLTWVLGEHLPYPIGLLGPPTPQED